MDDTNQRRAHRRLIAIVGALVCVVVALVLGFALPQLEGAANSTPDLLQTVDNSADDDASATKEADAPSGAEATSQDEAPSNADADATGEESPDQTPSNGDDSGQASDDSHDAEDPSSSLSDSPGNASGGSSASAHPSAQSQGVDNNDGASSGNKGSGSSEANSSAGPSGGDSNTGSQNVDPSSNAGQAGSSEQDDTEQTVTVEINTSVLGGDISTTTVEWSEGMNPYDALVKMGAKVNARDTQFGLYIASINGLAEKEHGGSSGWLYYVNGIKPNYGVSYCTLKPGDTVEWRYTVNGNS